MTLTAWLIGDDAEDVLKHLIGDPPKQAWVPLDTESPDTAPRLRKYRSSWAERRTSGEEFVDFAVPAETILEFVGPQALAHPKNLNFGTARRDDLRVQEGMLGVEVPRYFTTVATDMSPEQPSPLFGRDKKKTASSTIGEINVRNSFDLGTPPELIIGPTGPRLRTPDKDFYYTVEGLVRAARVRTEITKLPPETPIRCVWLAARDEE